MGGDWSRYWRAADRPLEAMHAHFERHVYHRHSHETYSFGMTEEGAQHFTCRGEARTSAAGMVMVFNPDDPHDGHAADEVGFTYRMVHIGPELVAEVLGEAAGRTAGLPLFTQPVVDDAVLAGRLRGLHGALVGDTDATALRRDELLDSVVMAVVRRAGRRHVPVYAGGGGRDLPGRGMPRPSAGGIAGPGEQEMARMVGGVGRKTARVVRELLHDLDGGAVSAGDLAVAAGRSRFAVYRSFREAYGMAPSDYQRQLRLRAARRLLAQGCSAADVAATTGFTDQSHLTRWFSRYYGVTPAAYGRAAAPTP
ncbi:AraC family transcriptional regulator [Sphaerisporangium sp. NPDC005289]|uniref:AraC family transcriptional regulator n=1 Tax=Sphaerisporangium sp. NPDC005289 TaxID=3155247 RepID=UPI0033B58088